MPTNKFEDGSHLITVVLDKLIAWAYTVHGHVTGEVLRRGCGCGMRNIDRPANGMRISCFGLDCTAIRDPLKKQNVWFDAVMIDRKSTRLNSSHLGISYA